MTEKGSAATVLEVYAERNQLIACFSRACQCLGYPAWLGWDQKAAEDPEWGPVVFIQLPNGQVSWHIRYDETPMFSHLELGNDHHGWDGHSNAEKFSRLMAWKVEVVTWPVGTLTKPERTT